MCKAVQPHCFRDVKKLPKKDERLFFWCVIAQLNSQIFWWNSCPQTPPRFSSSNNVKVNYRNSRTLWETKAHKTLCWEVVQLITWREWSLWRHSGSGWNGRERMAKVGRYWPDSSVVSLDDWTRHYESRSGWKDELWWTKCSRWWGMKSKQCQPEAKLLLRPGCFKRLSRLICTSGSPNQTTGDQKCQAITHQKPSMTIRLIRSRLERLEPSKWRSEHRMVCANEYEMDNLTWCGHLAFCEHSAQRCCFPRHKGSNESSRDRAFAKCKKHAIY